MFSFWGTFWAEFRAQSLLNQITFILPFLGLPTLIGFWSGRTTKTRLRKLVEGQKAEIALLLNQNAKLRACSFAQNIQDASESDDAYRTTDLFDLFYRNKPDLLLSVEWLSNEKLVKYWLLGDEKELDTATYFAKIAIAVEPATVIGRTVLELSKTHRSDAQDDEIFTSRDLSTEALRHLVVAMASRIDSLIENVHYEDAILQSRFLILCVSAHDAMRSPEGYNALYCLTKTLIMSLNGKKPSEQMQFEIQAVLDLFIDIVESTFPDKNHLGHFVSKFYYASALHQFGEAAAALDVLEKNNLPNRVGPCIGRESSACFATRHLYANLLFECHRPEEAAKVTAELAADLSRSGQLSDNHVRTYKHWAKVAQTAPYRRGKPVVFQNLGNFYYRTSTRR
jgi:hypothetical protein